MATKFNRSLHLVFVTIHDATVERTPVVLDLFKRLDYLGQPENPTNTQRDQFDIIDFLCFFIGQ